MCGLTGALYFEGGRHPKRETIERMTNILAHRGPDSAGYQFLGPMALGHRRLSIIDLSEHGREPMPNENQQVWVVFNGEIYNFRELRNELVQKGHTFSSKTDTEVIVHAYEEWGFKALERFTGMFSFALWDGQQKRLWLVRDPLGIKPMFYAQLPNGIVFGSEIKAVLEHPDVTREVDYQALEYFLSLNYTPAPYTLFKQVRQLEPGQYLVASHSGKIDLQQYWDLRYSEGPSRSEDEMIEEFSFLLENAVRSQLISDVPLGAFLSGGLDSSSIVYWANKHTDKPIQAFSAGFQEKEFDETKYARIVASHVGAEHSTVEVSPNLATILPKLVWHAEEPTADSSMVSVYYLAKFTREHVTVALSGDGSDEIMAGYQTYQAYLPHQIYRHVPTWLRRNILAPLIDSMPVSDGKVSTEFKLKRFAQSGDLTPAQAHASWRMIFRKEERQALLAPIASQTRGNRDVMDWYEDLFRRSQTKDPLHQMLYCDTRFYLPNDSLTKVDRMSMAHGLEVRVPFLDHNLVSFLASIPSRMKLKGRHKKYILKKAMRSRLPNEILYRNKAGFNLPHARWLRNELKPFVTDHLSPARVQSMNLLEPIRVTSLLEDHFKLKKDNSHQIWCLLSLSLWWQQFAEKKSP